MAFAIWPTGLDNTTESRSYSEAMANNLTFSSFDIGPEQVRRRSTGAPVPVSLTILCTEAQVTLFKTFYKDTLISGSQQFEWVQPIDKSPVVMQFLPSTQPSLKPAGGTMYRYSLQLMMFEDIPI